MSKAKNAPGKAAAPAKLPKRGGLRALTWAMIGVISVTTAVDGYCIYSVLSKHPGEALASEGMTSEQQEIKEEIKSLQLRADSIKAKGVISYRAGGVSGKNDIIINDEEEAMAALETLAPELGIEHPQQEYSITEYSEGEVFDTYTFKQYIEGISIDGFSIKEVVNKDGSLESIEGVHFTPPEDLDVSPKIDSQRASEKAEQEIYDTTGVAPEDFSLENQGKVIYVNSDDEPIVAYKFSVIDPRTGAVVSEIYIDANTGRIIDTAVGYAGSSSYYNTGYTSRVDNGTIGDSDRQIYVYDDFSDDDLYAPAKKTNAAALSIFENAVKVYDFFDINYDRALEGYFITLYSASERLRGFLRSDLIPEELTLRYTDLSGDGFTEQAASAVLADNISLNGIAKEYAKAMLPMTITADSVFYTGLADLFAELCEDYSDGGFDNSCDWISAPDSTGSARSMADPASTGNAAVLADTAGYSFRLTPDEQAHDSTLITHTAYLMSQGVNGFEALTTEQIGFLYFISLDMMPGMMTYEQFSDIIVSAAVRLNAGGRYVDSTYTLSDSQLMSVIEAFAESGITSTGVCRAFEKVYTNNAEFTVYDAAYSEYSDYHVTVTRNSDSEDVIDKDSNSPDFTLEGIDPGIYNITVTDTKNNEISYESGDIIVSDKEGEDYVSRDRILTKFGSVRRSVALVLDVSGSMRGEPISETRNSAIKFVDYVLSENPSIDISLVPYSTNAKKAIISSSDRDELVSAIQNLGADGGTNMYDGIDTGAELLSHTDSNKKLLFLLSDGYPENGPTGSDGSYESAVKEKAQEIKDSGIIIYTLGFFHNYGGTGLTEAQALMKAIASESCDYNVTDSSDLAYAFNDLADSVSGSYSIVVRIACPVDVTVSCSGETLCSDPEALSTRASFGSLSFEGENNEIKVLRLNDEANYELCINGYGTGTMDYSISFADDDGEYSDVRTFKAIPVSPDTVIATNTKSSGKTTLNIDSDGDGKFDSTYTAGENGSGSKKSNTLAIVFWVSLAVIFTALLGLELYFAYRRSQKNKVCGKCGAAVVPGTKFCRTCGEEIHTVPIWLPERARREKQSATAVTAKLVVMGICLLMTLSVVTIYRSAATTIFNQICDQELVSAQMLYDNSIEDGSLQQKYLSFLTKRYVKQVEDKAESGDISEETANSILTSVAQMDMGGASDTAEDYLKDKGITVSKKKRKYREKEETTVPASENRNEQYDPYGQNDYSYEDETYGQNDPFFNPYESHEDDLYDEEYDPYSGGGGLF